MSSEAETRGIARLKKNEDGIELCHEDGQFPPAPDHYDPYPAARTWSHDDSFDEHLPKHPSVSITSSPESGLTICGGIARAPLLVTGYA